MDKFQRNERIAALTKILSDSPSNVFTLGSFAEMFGSAKSTISEDIDILRCVFERFGMGRIETIPGAAGGIRYIPALSEDKKRTVLESLCKELSKKERILPGGYLYMLDIICNPGKISEIGCMFSSYFLNRDIDYVITVETKGIPIALSTARYLNVPLVIARHYSEATDGSSVNINYVSGSSKKLQTMGLSLKAIKRNSKLLFIDDFMKGGGTAKGIVELVKEFESDVVGIGVLVKTTDPVKKLVENYVSLLTLNNVNEEEGIIDINQSAKGII